MIRIVGVTVCLFLTAATGCGLPGRWESQSFKPEVARDEFRLLDESIDEDLGFRRATIILHEDGRYDAEIYYGSELETSSGDWERYNGKLTLIDELGQGHTYNIQLTDWDSKLKMVRRIKGTDVLLVMKRMPESE